MSRAEVLRASPALFESRWLDRLTRVRPFVPALVFGPLIGLLAGLAVARAGLLGCLVGVVGGYGLWTLAEYWIHRSLFHIEPRSRMGERVHFIIHGVHHDHPNDPLRLVMPPAVSVPLAVLFLIVFVAIFGTPLGWSVGAGFLAGYLAYDMLHYALHHHRNPRTALERRLRELHMRHHFEDDKHGYGISAPWWDIVFGTFARRGG